MPRVLECVTNNLKQTHTMGHPQGDLRMCVRELEKLSASAKEPTRDWMADAQRRLLLVTHPPLPSARSLYSIRAPLETSYIMRDNLYRFTAPLVHSPLAGAVADSD